MLVGLILQHFRNVFGQICRKIIDLGKLSIYEDGIAQARTAIPAPSVPMHRDKKSRKKKGRKRTTSSKDKGKKRETGEVGVGADSHERRARKRTGWKAHIESKTQGADLPSSWRLTSTRTHSLPRTLVFQGFTSHQLGSSSLTLGPSVDIAL